MKLGVDEDDAAQISTGSKILKCLFSCKSHNGPVTTVSELEDLVASIHDEKALHRVLNLEIRCRKSTLTAVKDTCPFFRQKTKD